MGKYMSKTFAERWRGRRYATSRDWPGGERMRLQITKDHGWSHIRQWPAGTFNSVDNVKINQDEQDLLERTGDDLTKAISLRWQRRKAEREFREVMMR